MQRTIARRTIWPSGAEVFTEPHPLDLALVAHSAAIETLQIDLVARGWVGLFSALLEPGADGSELIWRGNGPGGEAEIKRAYSALFGRFFGRAVLRHEHNCLDLRQVHDGLEITPGLSIRRRRIASARGDLPDWIGWNAAAGCYSVCEAKGSHDQGDWEGRVPPVLRAAMEQTERMEVVDAAGIRVQTKNWVVASRWGTVQNGKTPTIVTMDPLSDGRALAPGEAEKLPRETHALFLADLLRGVGRDELAGFVTTPSAVPAASFAQDTILVAGREGYAAVLIDGAGVFPLRGSLRRQRFEALRQAADEAGRKIAVVAVERPAAQAAARREPRPQDRETAIEDNGLTVSSDGVVVTWKLDALDLDSLA